MTDTPEPFEKTLAKVIWETSRADEGTISAIGAENIARALIDQGLAVSHDLYAGIISGVAKSEGSYSVQLGHAQISYCNDYGESETETQLRELQGRIASFVNSIRPKGFVSATRIREVFKEFVV